MLNGHLPSLWSGLNYSDITIKDWFDNEISLPKVSSLSLAFSIANMIKAAIHLNIYKTHRTERKFTHQTLSDHLKLSLFYTMLSSNNFRRQNAPSGQNLRPFAILDNIRLLQASNDMKLSFLRTGAS